MPEMRAFKCSICWVKCETEDKYKVHMRHRHPGEGLDIYFKCSFPWCNNIFENERRCAEHEAGCQREDNNNMTTPLRQSLRLRLKRDEDNALDHIQMERDSSEDEVGDSSEDEVGRYICNTCTVEFPTEDAYRAHRAIVHPEEHIEDIPMDENPSYTSGDSYLDEIRCYTRPDKFLDNFGKVRFDLNPSSIEPWYYKGDIRTDPRVGTKMMRDNKAERYEVSNPELEIIKNEMEVHPESVHLTK